jgi:hypothetical protein
VAPSGKTSVRGTASRWRVYEGAITIDISQNGKVLQREVAVRRARHAGLSWAEIGTLLGVTRQTMHRKYRRVG